MARKPTNNRLITRTRRRIGGKLVLTKRPDSAAIARPKKVHVTHGRGSRALLTAPFDLRTKVGKVYRERLAVITVHMGGDLTPPLARLADQATRLSLLEDLAWGELSRAGSVLRGDGLHPAFDAVLRSMRDHRSVLELIGLQRKTKDVPALTEYLAQKAKGTADEQ